MSEVRAAAPYSGPIGRRETYSVVLVDRLNQVETELEGGFASRPEAMRALIRWRRKHARARVCRLVVLMDLVV